MLKRNKEQNKKEQEIVKIEIGEEGLIWRKKTRKKGEKGGEKER